MAASPCLPPSTIGRGFSATDRRNAGFTLIEVLLAVTIFAIIMSTIYGVVVRTLLGSNRAEASADLVATGRELVTRMADDIEGALQPQVGTDVVFIGKKGDGARPADSLTFYATVKRVNSAAQKYGGRALIEYSVDQVEGRPGVFALRRHEEFSVPTGSGALGGGGLSGGQDGGEGLGDEGDLEGGDILQPVINARYLSDRVAGLRFMFADPMNGQIVDQWDSTGAAGGSLTDLQQPRGLPGAVKIYLYLYDDAGATHEFATMVDLPLANIVPTPPAGTATDTQ